MQVKKFEAKTMKDALELVKKHLGPEAVILSAKDNSRGFGLMGERSVEVTAAITDETLRRKKVAESKLKEDHRVRYEGSSARAQREFIDQAHDRAVARSLEVPTVNRRYIDILDEAAHEPGHISAMPTSGGVHQADRAQIAQSPTGKGSSGVGANVNSAVENRAATERVKGAAQRAWQAMNASEIAPVQKKPAARPMAVEGEQIRDLKAQISQLKGIIEGFQKMPQNILGMHPGAEAGICYDLSAMFQKLTRAGLSDENAAEILKRAQDMLSSDQMKRAPFMDAWVAKYILDQTQVAAQRTSDRFHVFVGPAGQGKTSALVKLASHMAICEKKKIAIITSDTQKVGAAEQLRIYSQILNVPFGVMNRHGGWSEFEARLKSVDHVLIDFPGLNLKSMAEVDLLRGLLPTGAGGQSVHYVQSVLANTDSAFETATRYQVLGFSDVIFTGLDEAAHHGLIYNFQKRFKVPLHSFGIGPQIPEDFEPATKERVVDLIFKLSKIKKEKQA